MPNPTGDRDLPQDSIPLPPPDAEVLTTACDYCSVGCGYKVYRWPFNKAGGPKAADNVFDKDYPIDAFGSWISPNQHNVISHDGVLHHVAIIGDPDATTVNVGGDYSIRGGTLARKLYNPATPTKDRLQTPLMRVRGKLQPITWDAAIRIVAEIGRYVLDTHSEMAWAMKAYSYQYYENTYAITKFAFGSINTAAFAFHDKCGTGSDTPGLSDAGINAFGAAYQDWKDADVICMSGIEPYETKSIMFLDWIKPGGAKIVFINPRKTLTAAYALANGGIHLQLTPGTDTVLNNALARYIIEQGWEDADWISSRVASTPDLALETKWRRVRHMTTFADYKTWLVGDDRYTLTSAETITGVAQADIIAAAELLARPKVDGGRAKVSFQIEKGNYWSYNYVNTASYVSLGLICGAGGRPGQMIGRGGGHQRGMIKGASYPTAKSPEEFEGNKLPLNLDKYIIEDNVRFMWVIGSNWMNAMSASQFLIDNVRRLTQAQPAQIQGFDVDEAIATLKQRVDDNGMVLIQQDIYQNDVTEFADLLLPAATWGETPLSRMQAERRLRHYSRFMDAPGDARPDWWIVAEVAKKMGYPGFDWADANEVFEEAADKSEGSVSAYQALIDKAKAEGQTGHEYLASLGSTGVQCPLTIDAAGEILETKHMHQDPNGGFDTVSGKAVLVKGDWDEIKDFQSRIQPSGDELWIINARVNGLWQTGFDDMRIPYRSKRYPVQFVEINVIDANRLGIESGDLVECYSDRVLSQLDTETTASVSAAAYVTDIVSEGVACLYFNFPGSPANSLAPAVPDPISNNYRYKLGVGRIRKIGTTFFKNTMPFSPRNLV